MTFDAQLHPSISSVEMECFLGQSFGLIEGCVNHTIIVAQVADHVMRLATKTNCITRFSHQIHLTPVTRAHAVLLSFISSGIALYLN